jgi:hypothetical protein
VPARVWEYLGVSRELCEYLAEFLGVSWNPWQAPGGLSKDVSESLGISWDLSGSLGISWGSLDRRVRRGWVSRSSDLRRGVLRSQVEAGLDEQILRFKEGGP